MGVELSAPSRGVLAWAVLRELGRAGVAARVERRVGFARHLAQRARQHPRLELLLEPELSVVCFVTPPATPSTPRSSCGCAAPPARYHLQRSSEATWRSGPAFSTPTSGWPTWTRSLTTSPPSATS